MRDDRLHPREGVLAQVVPQGRRRADRRLQPRRRRTAQGKAAADVNLRISGPVPVLAIRRRSTRGSPSTPTTPSPSTARSSSSGRARRPGSARSPPRSSDVVDRLRSSGRRADTNVTPNQGGTVGSYGIRSGGPQLRAAAAYAAAGAARPRLDEARRSGREPHRRERRRLGRRQVGDLRRRCIGGKLFNVDDAGDRRLQPGRGAGQGSPSAVHDRRHARAADRHPRQGDGHVHVHPQRPRAGDAPRPGRAPARPGARTAPARRSSRSTRARSSTSRTSRSSSAGNFLGVVAPKEYDAIQAAAQLKVTWDETPDRSRAPGTCSGRCATKHAGKPTDTSRRERRATSTAALRVRARRSLSATYTRRLPDARRRSARRARSPIVTPNSARRDLLEHAGPLRASRPHAAQRRSTCRRARCACSTTRASSASAAAPYDDAPRQPRSCRKRSGSPCGSSSCAGTSTAGISTAPPRCSTCAAESTRAGNIVAIDYTSSSRRTSTRDVRAADRRASRHARPGQGRREQPAPARYNVPNRRVTGKSLPLDSGYLKTAPTSRAGQRRRPRSRPSR